MDSVKYIGMDVHKEAISIAVLNASGKLVMECIMETEASSILQFLQGLSRSLQVIFEEGMAVVFTVRTGPPLYIHPILPIPARFSFLAR